MKFQEKLVWGLGLTAMLSVCILGGHYTGLFKSSPIRKEIHQSLSNLSGGLYSTTNEQTKIELRRDADGSAHKQLVVYVQEQERSFFAVDRINLFNNFGDIDTLHYNEKKGLLSHQKSISEIDKKTLKDIEKEIDFDLRKLKQGLEQAIEQATERRKESKKLRGEVYSLLKKTGENSYSTEIDGKDVRLSIDDFSYKDCNRIEHDAIGFPSEDVEDFSYKDCNRTKHAQGFSLEIAHETEEGGEKIRKIEVLKDYKNWENGLERAREFGLIDVYTNAFRHGERLSEQKEIEMDRYLGIIKKELQNKQN